GSTVHRAMIRYLSDGTYDASFGTGGKLLLPALSPDMGITAADLQPDGKLLTLSGGHQSDTDLWQIDRFDVHEVLRTASDALDITDDETALLTLTIDTASVSEAAGTGATTATVTRNTDTTSDL